MAFNKDEACAVGSRDPSEQGSQRAAWRSISSSGRRRGNRADRCRQTDDLAEDIVEAVCHSIDGRVRELGNGMVAGSMNSPWPPIRRPRVRQPRGSAESARSSPRLFTGLPSSVMASRCRARRYRRFVEALRQRPLHLDLRPAHRVLMTGFRDEGPKMSWLSSSRIKGS